MDSPSVAVVILNWNGIKDLTPCLVSLEKSTWENREIIVVDNGSSDDSCALVLSQFPSVTLLSLKENLGYAGGNNVGIEYALKKEHAFILLLNNDTIVDSLMLEHFVKYGQAHPEIGIVGGWPLLFSDPSRLDHVGGKWNGKTGYFDLIGRGEPSSFEYEGELDYVCGCSIFIRKTVFEKIGVLEPSFFLFWEESDFCMRAKRAGFRISFCKQATLLHKVSASFIGGSCHKLYFFWRNRFLWMERNCSPKERWRLTWRVLLPEVLNLYKLLFLKKTQLFLLKFLRSKKDLSKKKQKIAQYRASLQGVADYRCKKFGNGPAWIYPSRL